MKLIEQYTMFAIALAAAIHEEILSVKSDSAHPLEANPYLNRVWEFAKDFRDKYVFKDKQPNDDELLQLLIDTSKPFRKLIKKHQKGVMKLKDEVSAARLQLGAVDTVYSKIISAITELIAIYETCTATSLNALRTSIADDVVENRVNATRILSDLSTLLEKAKHEQSNLHKL